MSAIELAAGFVRTHEGLRLCAYQDGVGRWTIGYGHAGADVHAGLNWTEDQAMAALKGDLALAQGAVARLAARALSDPQMAALISFVFNLGAGALSGSALLAAIRDGQWNLAAREFIRFDHAGGAESKGLLIRRLEEAALFLKGS